MKRLLLELALAAICAAGIALITLGIISPKHKQHGLAKSSIVRLHFGTNDAFFCSGTVISATLVLTAGHCAAAAVLELPGIGQIPMPIIVKLADGTVVDSGAMPFAADPRSDQGMIVGHFESVTPQRVVTDPASNINTWLNRKLVSCGYPYAAKLFCVPVLNIVPHDFQFSGDSHLYPGMSGGPVFDAETGEIVGVNSAVEGPRSYFAHVIEIFSNLHVPQL